jgi:O-antigen/teichoic acid export membrane protein
MVSGTRQSKSLAHNAAWSLGLGLLVPTLVMVVTTRAYVHWLGVRYYGVFAVVNSALALAGVLRLGTTEATVKYVAEFRSTGAVRDLAGVVGGTMILYIGISALGSSFLVLGAPWIGASVLGLAGKELLLSTQAFQIAAIGFPAGLLLSVSTSVFAGFERYDRSTLYVACHITAPAGAGLAVLWSGGGLVALTWATVAASWVVAVAATLHAWAWTGISHASLRGSLVGVRRVLGFSVYSALNTVFAAAFTSADRLIVGSVLGPEFVSYYSVATSIASRVYTVTIALTQALLPRFSGLRARSEASGERQLFAGAFAFAALFALALATLLFSGGEWFLQVWMGTDFAVSTTPILMAATGAFTLLAVHLVSFYYLNAAGAPRLATGWYVLGGLGELAAIRFLVPKLGIPGLFIGMAVFPLAMMAVVAASFRLVALGPARVADVLRVLAFSLATGALSVVAGRFAGAATFAYTNSALAALAGSVLPCLGTWILALGFLWHRRPWNVLGPLWIRLDSLRRVRVPAPGDGDA